MNSYDIVKKAIKFDYPDRIPIWHSVLPGALYKYGNKLYDIIKKHPEDLSKNEIKNAGLLHYSVEVSDEIRSKFIINSDFFHIKCRNFSYGPVGKVGIRTDEWGIVWEKTNPGYHGNIIKNPLEKWEDLKEYIFPDPLDYWRWDLENLKKLIGIGREQDKYIMTYVGNFFEKMQWLRGFENVLIDIEKNQERIQILGDKLLNYLIKTTEKFGYLGIDGVMFADDWGTQQNLMINPNKWRELFKPYYKELFKKAHENNLDVHFHTDGNTLEIIPDLIEIGADVLNLQFSAMDIDEIARAVKNKVCIRTDIDRQYMLREASYTEMLDHIREICDKLGSSKGGIIGCGEVNEDCSLESVKAMYDGFEKFGNYKKK